MCRCSSPEKSNMNIMASSEKQGGFLLMEETISLVNEKVDVFNTLYRTSEKLQKHLAEMEKVLLIELEGTGSFYLCFDSSGLSKAVEGATDAEPDITIISTLDVFNGILTGKEKKMKAIVTKKIKLKAKKMKDLLLLRKLLSAKPEDLQ